MGMSTRRGTVKFLNDILEAAAETMMEQMKRNEAKFALIEDPDHCADVLGMSAVKIQDMNAKRCVVRQTATCWLLLMIRRSFFQAP